LDGLIFGLVDNGIVLAGMYLGVDIEGWVSRKLGKDANPLLGAVVGATSFNLISDAVAASLDPSMKGMGMGIAVGCLIPMMFIPFIERRKGRKRREREKAEKS
tara:strand:+ start:59 stop:367 length:309 start_codon:yes stop_codon:yes gene_type:complete